MVKIRKATSKDAEEILRIERESFPDPWSLNTLILEIENPLNEVFVIENEKVFGYVIGMTLYDEIHIGTIALESIYRNLGYGEKLLGQILKITDEKNLDVTLEVRVKNANAIHLYKKLGFVEEGIRKNYYGRGKDALIMWRRKW